MKNLCVRCKFMPVCSTYGGVCFIRKLLVKITQLFCKHEYEGEYIKGGFLVKDSWLVQPYQLRCKKCGKVRDAE